MKVLVECFHDAALVRALWVPVRRLGHEHCKGKVLRTLAKWNGDAVGIVDADTGKQHSSPNEMAQYREHEDANGLRLLKHRDDPQKSMVVIEPRLEEWLLLRAEACGLRLAGYGLPQTARDMHRNPRCDRKPGFRRFLQDLLAADKGMQTLKKWIGG